MPSYIIKINDGVRDWYLEYSTISDSPATYGLSLKEFRQWYLARERHRAEQELDERLVRVEANGTSSIGDDDLGDTLLCNRAGPDEREATVDEIIKWYCHRQPLPDGTNA